MSSNRERRVIKELRDIHSDQERSGVTAEICDPDGNLNHLKGTLTAPPDSPYAGGTFKVDIKIPPDYPFKAPVIKFETKIWHPNISSQTGAICLDVLGPNWSPVHTIKSLLLSLRMLLEVPNPKDPQDAEVAKMMITDPELFARIANEWAVKYAGAAKQDEVPPQYRSQEKPVKKQDDTHRYKGYNKDLVDRFVNMGFDLDNVVDAFLYVGIDRNNGEDYELEEAYMGDITARLLGEQ